MSVTANSPHTLPDDEQLDPELRAIVASIRERALLRPPLASVTIEQIRARAAAEFAAWNLDPAPVASVTDLIADTDVRGVPLRLYEPDPEPGADGALLVYLHGGGWTIGDLTLEDAAIRHLAVSSGIRIVSVDYRLLPEHPFPAALEDVDAVLRWLRAGRGPTVAPQRIALGGASAGANVALGTALRLRDARAPLPRLLLLLYGAYAGGAATQSLQQFGDGRFGLPASMMQFFWQRYSGDGSAAPHPHAVPLHAELHDLPATFVSHAGLDVLRDDSIALVAKLRQSNVAVQHIGYPGAIHGFTQYLKGCALARCALDDAARALRAALL